MACTIHSKLVVSLHLFVRQISTIRELQLLVRWSNHLGLFSVQNVCFILNYF